MQLFLYYVENVTNIVFETKYWNYLYVLILLQISLFYGILYI